MHKKGQQLTLQKCCSGRAGEGCLGLACPCPHLATIETAAPEGQRCLSSVPLHLLRLLHPQRRDTSPGSQAACWSLRLSRPLLRHPRCLGGQAAVGC